MVDLFGDAPEPEKRKRKKGEAGEKVPADLQRAVDAFYQGYIRRFNGAGVADRFLGGEKIPKAQMVLPVINGRGVKDMKAFVEAWGPDRVVELIGKFFASVDPRVASCYGSNYSMRHFCLVAEYLQISSNGRAVPARKTMETAHEVNLAIGARRRSE